VDVAPLRLGTRASPLARAQADRVRAALEDAHPGLPVEMIFIRTSGDAGSRAALGPGGVKGLFVKEIEEALLAGTIDAGVHSMKDLPATLPRGLVVGVVPARASAHDMLLSEGAGGISALPLGARVGTASVRRRAQLLARRRDLEVMSLRGNVDTRLRKWRDDEVDALILAAAGLERLGLSDLVARLGARALSIDEFLPAVGQGALALECRTDDERTRALLAAIEDAPTAAATRAERAFLLAIGGDCNTPLAAHATVEGGSLRLRALVTDLDGRRWLEDAATAPLAEAAELGRTLAERLLAAGAAEVLGKC
jgi:hydroxymethylbilane synthase